MAETQLVKIVMSKIGDTNSSFYLLKLLSNVKSKPADPFDIRKVGLNFKFLFSTLCSLQPTFKSNDKKLT